MFRKAMYIFAFFQARYLLPTALALWPSYYGVGLQVTYVCVPVFHDDFAPGSTCGTYVCAFLLFSEDPIEDTGLFRDQVSQGKAAQNYHVVAVESDDVKTSFEKVRY